MIRAIKGSKTLPTLQPKDQVRMQVQNHWIPATVAREAGTPNSYIVQTNNGKNYHRNSASQLPRLWIMHLIL